MSTETVSVKAAAPQASLVGEQPGLSTRAMAEAIIDGAVSPEWARLRDASRAAWTAFGHATRLTDSGVLGREPTDDEEAVYEKASNATDDAFEAAMRYEPFTATEFAELLVLTKEQDRHIDRGVFNMLVDIALAAGQTSLDHIDNFLGAAKSPAGLSELVAEWHAAWAARDLADEDDEQAVDGARERWNAAESAVHGFAPHNLAELGTVAALIDEHEKRCELTDNTALTPVVAMIQHLDSGDACARAAWTARFAAWSAAKAREDTLIEHVRQVEAQIAAEMPDDLVDHSRRGYRLCKWHRLEVFDADNSVSPRLRPALRELLSTWLLKEQELRATAGTLALDEQSDEADDVTSDAYIPLLATAPPDAAALAWKHLQASIEMDAEGRGYNDLGLLCFHLHNCLAHRVPAQMFLDATRLAGVDHPGLHLSPFNPREWIKQFEQAGGMVTHSLDNGLETKEPHGSRPRQNGMLERCRALLAGLYAKPWQVRAVELMAEDRRSDGGDPVLDPRGEPWPNGPRAPGPRHKLLLEELDLSRGDLALSDRMAAE